MEVIISFTFITSLLILGFVINNYLKLKCMSTAADEIKQALADANAKTDKIAVDVAALHAKIDGLSLNPTAAEVQEIKDAAAALNTKLQGVDDATPEETPA
jgi:outer membrane murein-binding lipoprotein Lpp